MSNHPTMYFDSPGEDTRTNSDQPVTSDELAVTQPRKITSADTVEFNVKGFYSMVEKNGLYTNWEQSYMCPCVNPMTLAPNPDCPLCHGVGRAYLPAVKNVQIVIQENGKGKHFDFNGQYDSGTAKGSVQSGYRVSAWDRITVPDFTARQQYLFNVTDDRLAHGHYIPYDVKDIIYCAYMAKDGALHKAVEGIDYTFDREHDKFYPKDTMNNANVTMILNTTIRFIVADVDKELRYQYTDRNQATRKFDEMPRLVTLKREEAYINNIPLVNPDTNDLATKAQLATIKETPVTDTDSGFGLNI